MSDLISRSALLEKEQWFNDEFDYCDCFPFIDPKDVENAPAVDAVDIEKALAWLEGYSILDRHEVYTNGVLLVPLFRVEQALVHKAYNGLLEGL